MTFAILALCRRARAASMGALATAIVCACLVPGPTRAATPGPLAEASLAAREVAGPLAISTDGRYLVHVDSAGVLHRVELADRRHAYTLALGERVLQLATSRTARKVVLFTSGACLGVADFGTQPPAVAWAPRRADGQPDPLAHAWTARPPAACQDDQESDAGVPAFALSVDGKLLAWRDAVIDLESHRLVARLPAEATTLRFVDGDRKLFAGFVASGYRDESIGNPDSADVATWDLASGDLHDLLENDHSERTDPTHRFSDISSATGTAWWIDTAHWQNDTRTDPAGTLHTTLRLMAARPGVCGAPALRAKLEDADGDAFIVDPFGRWAATIARSGPDATFPHIGPDGSRLEFFDLATGRRVHTLTFPFELHGAVASADGASLQALAAPIRDRHSGVRPPALPGLAPGDEVREFAVPPALLANARDTATGWTAASCALEDEEPGARLATRAGGALAAAWTLAVDDRVRPISSDLVSAVIARPDGSLWLTRAHDLAQLDAGTGRVLRTAPLPAGEQATSRYAAASDGFVNAQGDTLTWRPASGGGRRVIETRAAWIVEAFEVRGRTVLVDWAPKPGTPPPTNEDGRPEPDARRFAFYDIASGRRLADRPVSEVDPGQNTWDELSRRLSRDKRSACHDEAGALTSGFDWRIDALGSPRAWRCTPTGASTTFWPGMNLRRDDASLSHDADASPALLAQDGPLGVVLDAGALQVFDAASRSQPGRIDLPHNASPSAVTIAPLAKLVLVQVGPTLTAYRLP